jgi:hypothetical protein
VADQRERVAQDSGDPQRSKRRVRQIPQPPEHELAERVRQRGRRDGEAARPDLKEPLRRKRAEDLNHPQWVSSRSAHHFDQPRSWGLTDLGADKIIDVVE